MLTKHNSRNQFLYKKSYLEQRLQQDVIEDGTAYIPCRVNGMEDIISRFSVSGCESLNSEFSDFIIGFIEFVPPEYPVVLEIYGPEFSPEEKKIINNTITSEMDYLLGKTEEIQYIKKRRFLGIILGTVLSGIFLTVAKRILSDVPLEFFFVLFWLFADAFVRYLFMEKLDFRQEKIRMARLASMNVEFKIQDKERKE